MGSPCRCTPRQPSSLKFFHGSFPRCFRSAPYALPFVWFKSMSMLCRSFIIQETCHFYLLLFKLMLMFSCFIVWIRSEASILSVYSLSNCCGTWQVCKYRMAACECRRRRPLAVSTTSTPGNEYSAAQRDSSATRPRTAANERVVIRRSEPRRMACGSLVTFPDRGIDYRDDPYWSSAMRQDVIVNLIRRFLVR